VLRASVQQQVCRGSSAAPSCAGGTGVLGWMGVLDSALLLQVNSKWHLQEEIPLQLPLGGGKGRPSQLLPKHQGGGSCVAVQAGGHRAAGRAVDLPGSVWESPRARPVLPGLSEWVPASPQGRWSSCGLGIAQRVGRWCSAGDCPDGVVGGCLRLLAAPGPFPGETVAPGTSVS